MTKSIYIFLLFVLSISFVTSTSELKDLKNLKVIRTSLSGSSPSLLKRCQRDESKQETNSTTEPTSSKNTTRLECSNTNERIYIRKAEILIEAAECHKTLLPSLYVSQLCNNEIKCEISVDDDFLDICDDCSNKKVLNLEYICTSEDDESDKKNAKTRSKRFSEKYKDKVNRASRVLANNLGRMPLRLHYDAFYDPLYYEEDYFNDYYYYLDPRFRTLGLYY